MITGEYFNLLQNCYDIINRMNLLRNANFCNMLKQYHHRSSSISIPLSYVSQHNDCKNQFQGMSQCAKIKTINNLHNCSLIKHNLEIFRSSSSSYQSVPRKNDFFSQLKCDIRPYSRLIRFDRPIGMELHYHYFKIIV